MKFQKHLEWHRVPDWRDAYFNYKQLKKDLKKVKDIIGEIQSSSRSKIDVDTLDRIQELGTLFGNPSNSPSQSRKLGSLFGSPSLSERSWFEHGNDFMVVHQKSLRTYAEDEVFYETELFGPFSDAEHIRIFFSKLDTQLNTINSFYKHKEGEYISHAQQLQNQLEILFDLKQGHASDIEESFVERNAARAMKLLRAGFMEFYKSLGFLKNYSLLNRMAFGKILKKHDKLTGKSASETYLRAVHMSYFSTSDKILRIMEQVKSIFTEHFSKGNRKNALACLQPIPPESYNINFVLGLFTGCSFSLLVTFVLLLVLPHNENFPSVRTAFPIFSTLVLFILHMYMYACNIYLWRKARINYAYIFEFEPRTELKYQDMLLLSTLITMLVIGGMVLYLVVYSVSFTSEIIREIIPLGVLLVLLGILVLPFNICYRLARYIFLHCLLRIMLSPLFKVVLADFFLADQLTSQVIAFRNLGYILCYYGGSYFNKTQNGAHCASMTSFQYPLGVLPYWWRLMQCLRRWVDMRDPVQLANAGKYLVALVAVVIKITYSGTDSTVGKTMVVVSSVCATAYQLYWDLVMDWGLLQRRSSNPWLRDKLMIERKPVYFVSMGINVLLRLVWMFSLFHFRLGATENMGMEFILAAIEVLRRGHWNFYRLENEHLNNIGKFRAIKVVPLPFEDNDYSEVLSNVTPVDARKRTT